MWAETPSSTPAWLERRGAGSLQLRFMAKSSWGSCRCCCYSSNWEYWAMSCDLLFTAEAGKESIASRGERPSHHLEGPWHIVAPAFIDSRFCLWCSRKGQWPDIAMKVRSPDAVRQFAGLGSKSLAMWLWQHCQALLELLKLQSATCQSMGVLDHVRKARLLWRTAHNRDSRYSSPKHGLRIPKWQNSRICFDLRKACLLEYL